MWGVVSCIDDNSTLEGSMPIPQLSIAGHENPVMPIKNFYAGENCTVIPEITYTGGNEKDLQYEWSVGTYRNGLKGELEVVSHEKVLEYRFVEGGSYYAQLNVSDGKVGCSMYYQLNINRSFEEGYVIVSNDESGNANMAWVKIMTPEEIADGKDHLYLEHCLENMNEGLQVNGLVNVLMGSYFRVSDYTNVPRIFASSKDRCFFLDPNTFTLLTELKYDELYPDFEASHFMNAGYYPCAYDAKAKKFAHLNLEHMFVYEYPNFAGFTFDDCFIGSYDMWGSTYYIPLFVRYDAHEVLDNDMNSGLFGSTGDLLRNEDILTAFIGDMYGGWSPNQHILTSSKENPSICYLHRMSSITGYQRDPSVLVTKQFSVDKSMAVPVKGTSMIYCADYSRHFYYAGNAVYVFLATAESPIFPLKSEPAIRFSDDEEITFLGMNGKDVLIATYDKKTKRGNFYIYDAKDVRTDNLKNVEPKAVHKNCADRITSIMYKPSINY